MLFKNLKIGQKLFLGFGTVTMLFLVIMGYTYINFEKESKAIDINFHTYNVIRESNDTLISLINMETGARGFALTGKDDFLQPFNEGKIDYEKHYSNIKNLTSSNAAQQKRLENLQKSYEVWLNWENENIVEGRKKVNAGQIKLEDLIKAAQTGNGKKEMDNIRSILSDVIKEEEKLLETRNNNLIRMEMQTRVIMALGGLIGAVLAFGIANLVIRMVINPVSTVTNTFKEISEGEANLEVRLNIKSKDELGDMSRYFNKFMMKLKELITENRNQTWIKTGQTELNEKMSGEQSITTLCNNIITYLSKHVNAQIGAIYVNIDDDFKLYGSYAYNRRKNLSNEIKLGEGIVGQAALEKQPIIITNVPEDYIKIISGVGEAVPKNIAVIPCLYNNEVKAVIELGSFSEFTDIQLQFLEQISMSTAISIHSAEARTKMTDLLNKTLEQSEELQVQQEELRQSNEELEEQARALMESESRLQTQQEELRSVNEELEERTRNLEIQRNDISVKNENLKNAQAEIEQKAKALEAANKYKSEFLANMSHELRTPLNSILVLSQILANKKDDNRLTDKQLEYAQTINSSGKDLLRLINDVLDLSKVEAGKMDINYENVDLKELALYVKRSFDPIAAQKGLYFNIEFEKDAPEYIISDNMRVQQIVNNLLSNAFKFTQNGGVKMAIGRLKKEKAAFGSNLEKGITVEITDTGIGIPGDKQKVIFEAFKQSDGTTSRKYGGTGLGLSISKELAKLLGGAIYLKSSEGKGSTFTLILPDNYSDSAKLSDDATWNTEEIAATVNYSKDDEVVHEEKVLLRSNSFLEKQLLIIEDDVKFSAILSDLASDKGYNCLTARDGESGIMLAKLKKPDAILLDIGLPDISGWEVIEKLKDDTNTKNIPVHVISGREEKISSEKIDGIIGYLRKPVNLEDIENVLKRFESNVLKPFKKLLIVDSNESEIEAISSVLSKREIEITSLDSGEKAFELLKKENFDCMIVDLKLKDMDGLRFLDMLNAEDMADLPIIINTKELLTQEEELKLKQYAQSIIIKGSRSIERLVAETSLFLHDVDTKMERKQIDAIKLNHEQENVLKDKRILIVDDDMRNVFALTSVLEEKGVTVIVGRNGKEGIEKLQQSNNIDLILMDVMMPEMDGYTAMQEIRKLEKNARIPIIALTAKAMKEDRERCIEAGADDYLTKPLDIDKLISLLRVWLYK